MLPSLLMTVQGASWWFASPQTWTIDTPSTAQKALIATMFSPSDLDRILRIVNRWLEEWVKQGSNAFIHRQLYHHRFPRCLQDAYMSLSAYLQKTDLNKHIIFGIIEDRINELVAQGLPTLGYASHDGTYDVLKVDTLECLARVQALFVYQCIGLYDGNIRLRRMAEQQITVLESWVTQLLEHIKQTPGSGESMHHSNGDSARENGLSDATLIWYSWILAESTRRIWLLVAGVQGIYKLIQKDSSPCMGGQMFTSRQGFWEARSAVVWEKQCSEVYAGLVRLTDVEKLFMTVPFGELNDFAKLVLECTYGAEQIERWAS